MTLWWSVLLSVHVTLCSIRCCDTLQSQAVATALVSVTGRSLLTFRGIDAWPEFKHNVPNGQDVKDKFFGHTANHNYDGDPDYDTFGHNKYGRDYCAYDEKWNVPLCSADSDLEGSGTRGWECCRTRRSSCCTWVNATAV